MAPFDQDPKNTDNPPVRNPAAGDSFDGLFKEPEGNSNAAPGDFTKLFGKPPTPEPLAGIGEAKPPEVLPAEPHPPAPAPIPGSAKPLETTCPGPTAPIAATSVQRPMASDNSRATREGEPGKQESLTNLFAAPSAAPAAGTSQTAPEPPPIPPKADFPSPAKPPLGGSEFTRLFGSSARVLSGEPAVAPCDEPTAVINVVPGPQKLPGPFTQLFSATAPPPAQTPPRTAPAPVTPVAPKSASQEEFASIFDFPLRDSSFKKEKTPEPASGALSNLFSPSPAVPPPEARDPGAFTKLFQSPGPRPETAEAQRSEGLNKVLGTTAAVPPAGSFTGIFGRGASSQDNQDNFTKPASYPPQESGSPITGSQEASGPGGQPRTMWPSAAPSPTAGGAPLDGATRIFNPAVTPSAAPPPAIPAGPSAFTKVISGNQVEEAMRQAGLQGQAPSPATPAPPMPQFFPAAPISPVAAPMPNPAPPGMNMPGVPPTQASMPQMQMPHMHVPQMQMPYPQIPQPQVPQPPMPQPPASSAGPAKVNWMPLIIGVNVFFLIVVILILIFALRK